MAAMTAEWRAGGGYFDEIKQRNDDELVSMANAAGAPEAVDRGVYVGGGNYKKGEFSIGAIDYYSADIINIFYGEMKHALPLAGGLRLQFALQYSDQRSTGNNLLRGTDFSANQWGGKVEIAARSALFSAAYTSAGGDTSMQAPWSSYPATPVCRWRISSVMGGTPGCCALPTTSSLSTVSASTVFGSTVQIRRSPGSSRRKNSISTCNGPPTAAR